MLWLCITFPQLPLEALCPDDAGQPIVVTECEGNARWILCCNSTAEHGGLKTGMNYTTALAMLPNVRMLERKPLTEHYALLRLSSWAYQFSSQVICGDIPQNCATRDLHACGWKSARVSSSLEDFDSSSST